MSKITFTYSLLKKPFKLEFHHKELIQLIKDNLRPPSYEFLAQKLHIHKNTVIYRMERLQQNGYLDQNGVPDKKKIAEMEAREVWKIDLMERKRQLEQELDEFYSTGAEV